MTFFNDTSDLALSSQGRGEEEEDEEESDKFAAS